MTGWRVLLTLAVSLATGLLLFSIALLEFPVQPGEYSFCVTSCSSFITVGGETRYALHESTDLFSPDLYWRPWPGLPIWKKAIRAPILRLWKNSHDVTQLRTAANRPQLFVQHDGLIIDGQQFILTDAIDIASGEPQLLIGGGICCMAEDAARLAANQDKIRAVLGADHLN